MQQHKTIVFVTLIFLAWSVTGVCAENIGNNNQSEPTSVSSEELEYDDFDLDDEFDDESAVQVFDPLRGYNRFMTGFNDKLYFWLLKPAAKGIAFVIPEPGRLAISRCFRNIMFPVRLVNNLLQFKIKRAGIESARFGVNTTIGVLGFGDPAKSWFDLDAYEEDFGQTLGAYGVGSGFHLVLPLLGPSNARDTIGLVPDYFLNPLSYIGNYKIESGIKVVDKTNYTSLHIGEYESIKRDAIDFYPFMRNAYEQNRKMKIQE
ncbi:MAG: VacJ family lipoprotein [Deltaproteobacteria bacterium]|nr:VacJ family lipoprotein [Deltaproteobacteria bacterium]